MAGTDVLGRTKSLSKGFEAGTEVVVGNPAGYLRNLDIPLT